MTSLTDEQARLFREPNFAVAATIRADGAPQLSVVWVDEACGCPVFNTTRSRAKGRHLRRDPRLSLLVVDRNDPYRYIEVQGTAELDPEDAAGHIDKLARKYIGSDFPSPFDRVIVRISPSRIYDYLDGPPPAKGASDVRKP